MGLFEDLFTLSGKQALVTGGATGIGRMIASGLARAGAHVMIASRKGGDCERVAGVLTEEAANEINPGRVTGFAGDVSTEDGVLALAEEVRKRTERLHILFNNAGATWGEPLETFPHTAWKRVLDLNVAGLFTLTRELLPLLEAAGTSQDPARVVNLGSVMGTQPIGDGAYSYAASKAAVHHLTKILAKELAHRQITVNAFAPGPFPSKMTAFATDTERKRVAIAKGIPLGRIGRPDDIAAAALYLCGKGGAYVTGCILPLDGGLHVATGGNLFDEAAQA